MISCSDAPFIPLGEVWNEVRSNEAKGEEEDKMGVAHTGGPISFFLKASRFKVRSWKENFRDVSAEYSSFVEFIGSEAIDREEKFVRMERK